MIKLQSILESLLSEVGENTATPYDFKVKREWEDEETWYEWKTDDEGEDPVKYTMTITKWSDYTGRGDDREFNYEVEFGIDVEGGGTDYYATSKTRKTGNMRRVMATVIAALKQEIAKDNKKPGVRVSSVYMSPSKEEETDQRRAKLYLSYIEKNKPAGSTVTYSDRGSIEIKLPKPGRKETEKINEAFDKPYPTETVTSNKSKESHSFTTSEEHEYAIEFDMEESTGGEETWSSEFYLKNPPSKRQYGQYSITGTGDQMRVFATVLSTMKDFLDRRRPKVLEFVANKTSGTSRDRLYSTLVNRYTPTGYRVETQDFQSFNAYRIVRT